MREDYKDLKLSDTSLSPTALLDSAVSRFHECVKHRFRTVEEEEIGLRRCKKFVAVQKSDIARLRAAHNFGDVVQKTK